MILENKQKNIALAGLLVFINALFIVKYLPRYMPYAGTYTVAYAIWVIVTYMAMENKKIYISRYVLYAVLAILCVGSFFAFKRVPATSLNVNRWSDIYKFWQGLHHGSYPYQTGQSADVLPDDLPVYYIVALPFYFLKEIGYMPLLAVVALVLYFIKRDKHQNTDHSFACLLLLASPCIYWEIVARSTVFFASLFWLVYADWFFSKKIEDKKHLYLSAIFGGLLLSTRLVYCGLMGLWGIYLLKHEKNKGRVLYWGLIAGVVLILTILPFYIMFPKEFIQHDPIHAELNDFFPSWFNFVFIGVALVFGLLSKNKEQLMFLSGILLFLIVFIYFAYHVVTDGWQNAFYNSYADISYFILPVPFLLASLTKNNGNKSNEQLTQSAISV